MGLLDRELRLTLCQLQQFQNALQLPNAIACLFAKPPRLFRWLGLHSKQHEDVREHLLRRFRVAQLNGERLVDQVKQFWAWPRSLDG
jgi:hypothetical protein